MTDPSLIGQTLNAVMKVHSADGSVIKTTSFPMEFITNSTGEPLHYRKEEVN